MTTVLTCVGGFVGIVVAILGRRPKYQLQSIKISKLLL